MLAVYTLFSTVVTVLIFRPTWCCNNTLLAVIFGPHCCPAHSQLIYPTIPDGLIIKNGRSYHMAACCRLLYSPAHSQLIYPTIPDGLIIKNGRSYHLAACCRLLYFSDHNAFVHFVVISKKETQKVSLNIIFSLQKQKSSRQVECHEIIFVNNSKI